MAADFCSTGSGRSPRSVTQAELLHSRVIADYHKALQGVMHVKTMDTMLSQPATVAAACRPC